MRTGAATIRENHTYGGQDEKGVSNAMLMIELERLAAEEMRLSRCRPPVLLGLLEPRTRSLPAAWRLLSGPDREVSGALCLSSDGSGRNVLA